jgi:HSP20 family protein
VANERSHPSGVQTLERREQGRSLYKSNPLWGWSGDLFSGSPFSLIRAVTEEMDRMFSGFGSSQGQAAFPHWVPPLEMREKDGKLIITADLPGVEKKDVRVEVENDMIAIEGERKREHEESRGEWQRSERAYGHFYRAIHLPEGAKGDMVRAEFQNGVLTITIPVEPSKSTRHQVEIR